jgi:type I restriction enzyme S subunit
MITKVLAKKSFKIDECLDRIVDNRGKTPPLSDTGIELLEVNAIVDGRKTPAFENVRKFVSEETYAKWFRSGHPRRGDTLISTVGAIGRVAFVQDERGCIAQNIVSLRPKADVLYGEFLYYLLSSSEVQHRLLSLNIGVAQPSLKVPHLLSLEIDLPSFHVQQRISDILSAYDELIENSRQRIKILESMARALYREWFVFYRFPGHEFLPSSLGDIPEGWEVRKIAEFADFTRGVEPGSNAYKTEPDDGLIKFLRVGDFSKRDSDLFVEEQLVEGRILKPTDIAISLDGSVGIVRIGMNGAYSSGIRRVDVKDRSRLGWVFAYQLLLSDRSQETIHAHAKGTTIKHAGSAVAELDFVSPPGTLIAKFEGTAAPIMEQVLILNEYVKNLRVTRDLLLPRLLSGQIEVGTVVA